MIQAFFRASPSTVPPNHPDNNNSISRNSSYESLPSLSTESGAMTGTGGISSYDDVDNLIPNLLHGGKKIRKLTKKFETNSPPVTVVPNNNSNNNSVSRSPNHPENSDNTNLSISIADEIVAEEEGIALREEK
jgi:hypothetical protein